MPWWTPTLKETRMMVRDNITAMVAGAAMVPNNALRVMADAMAGCARLTLEYIDWLAKQLLPDTSETEWLDRHGDIWLSNSDGTIGRKNATLAVGSVLCTGENGSVVPAGTILQGGDVEYETLLLTVVGDDPTPISIRALDPGTIGNQAPGSTVLSFSEAVTGVDSEVTVVTLSGGTDAENDDDLRTRVLLRIQQPPMGGDAKDFVQWALSVPGVTRAWSYPLEMGIGTVTVRFMMDDLRVDDDGFPTVEDIETVKDYLDSVRPVAIKDFFVVAPISYPINMTIIGLVEDTEATRAAIEASLLKAFTQRTKPGQTWYRAWTEEAVNAAAGVEYFDLTLTNNAMHVTMISSGYMPVLGTITYQE